MSNYRPSAVPLVTVDPFFSLWSMSDRLYDDVTHHWTGRRNPMSAGVWMDGKYYKVMGEIAHDSDKRSRSFEPYIPQVEMEVLPTQTKYAFADERVRVELLFTSPLLMDRLDILSRPVSYIEYTVQFLDGKEHDVKFHFDISAECCIDKLDSNVIAGRTAQSVYVGNEVQNVLSRSGDSVCVEWGYLHLAGPDGKLMRGENRVRKPYQVELEMGVPYRVMDQYPYLCVDKEELQGVITIAYDDVKPISYLDNELEDYYKKFYPTFDEMLAAAVAEYDEIKALCETFNEVLIHDAKPWGESYVKIACLAYRQAIAAHKLVEDTKGSILFLSKECHSNGCIGTLDVTYPSIPLFLKYNPELVKGMLRPILEFGQSDLWEYEFAPHDVGQYPLADCQVYGYGKDPAKRHYDKQMPVEECGNMLLSVAAVAKAEGNKSFAEENQPILKQWTDYLVKYGYNPENQLCTDDFAGHLAHNCNLSLKAILGIAAYSILFEDASYMAIAKEYAARWQVEAANGEATRLAFDKEDSWSLKYNIVWDKLLDIHIFDESVFEKEVALYLTKMNRYGVPLDCRSDYTKVDWEMWTVVMTDNEEYNQTLIERILTYINETPSRVPLSDWYYTTGGEMEHFQNRTVVGGLFIPMLKEK